MQELDMVKETFSSFMFYHYFFSAFLALPFVINLITLFTYKNFASLNKKIWYVMPLLFFLVAISTLSGLNLSAMGHNFTSPLVLAMFGYILFVIGGEIYRIKLLKVARRTNEEAMLEYAKKAKILYCLDLLGFAILFFGSKGAV